MTTPSATMASGSASLRAGRLSRSTSRKIAPSSAAITARAEVRKTGEKSATATRVAGSDPEKIMTPRRPLPQPALVRSMCPRFPSRFAVTAEGWHDQEQ
jgi:hypothetical protein